MLMRYFVTDIGHHRDRTSLHNEHSVQNYNLRPQHNGSKNYLHYQSRHDDYPLVVHDNRSYKGMIKSQFSLVLSYIYTDTLKMLLYIFQRNILLMLPWVVLGVLLLVGLLFSVFFTSIVYFLDDNEVHHILYGVLTLLFGLLTFGK